MMGCWDLIAHWVKTLVLGLGSNAFDVFSDIGTGLYHYYPKNVTRFLGNSSVPDNCFPYFDFNDTRMFDCLEEDNCVPQSDFHSTGMFKCLEEDTMWAAFTFAFIQLPAVVFALSAASFAFLTGCEHSEWNWQAFGLILLIFIPFPIIVVIQQVASLFIRTIKMEALSAVFLFGEGSLEASPQLLLLLYSILSDSERNFALIQMVSTISSILTISKTSIELFLSRSFPRVHLKVQDLTHDDSVDDSDSMLKDRSLLQKLKLMVEFSPAFLTSLIFKVGSISIICTFLKGYSVIYLSVGVFIAFIIAFIVSYRYNECERAIFSAIFYSLTNVTILAKSPRESRKDSYPQMLTVSITWLTLHTLTLIMLMIWFGTLDSSIHLPHWSEHRFTFRENPALFYSTTCAMIVFGPMSIFALWRLKRQVKRQGSNFWTNF